MDKKELRKDVKSRIAAMSSVEKEQGSSGICDSLEKLFGVCDASVVALFSPLPDEPQIWSLVDELSKKKGCCVATCRG